MEHPIDYNPTQPLVLYRTTPWTEIIRILRVLGGFCLEQKKTNDDPIFDNIIFLTDKFLANIPDIDRDDPDGIMDVQLMSFIDVELVRGFIDEPDNEELQTQLVFELTTVAAALNLLDGIDMYPADGLIDFLVGVQNKNATYNMVQFVYSLRQFVQGHHRLEVVQYAIPVLGFFKEQELIETNMVWRDAFVIALLLDLVWYNYRSLSEIEKRFLCSNYFYTAIMMGVPVQKILEDHLYEVRDILDYGIESERIAQSLEENKENVVVDTESGQTESFLSLIKKINLQFREKAREGFNQQRFIQDLYATKPDADKYSSWLRQALYIFFRAQNADLVEDNFTHEEFGDYEAAKKDTMDLLRWSIDEKNFDKIVAYFKGRSPKVKLSAFLYKFQSYEDLTKEDVQDHYLALSAALKKGGVIPEDEDIIEFHEEDGAFHWNNNIGGR